ncbi:MBL fold metallo-hydrolase [Cohnella xylanilytica]|uniref:MBL fold metallo-hydrolase n=1 Tax=Cohnella xylanilytica TaxID=557555 RepID=A0A841U376_9BACL|nr:MBL fold metallo-hydrolase [Cohnella xylanilytica]MBB6692434.1 MBL fold metallo-hydrolase [Cohnella xylanilytica]
MREQAAVTRHENGWIRAKVPVPFSLKWVNAYLLPEEGGAWTLIDPGLRSADTEAFWEETLKSLGIRWGDIRRIVLTHHHPDHYGLSGWFQERTGAPVHLSMTARRYAMRLWGERETFSGELIAAFREHGLPEELTEGMRGHLRGVFGQVLPHPEDVRPLPPAGERFEMAGRSWELIGGEGHAPGHISFYDPETGVVLCGDQVLPDITPNIGWMPDADPDPLGSYLASLREMRRVGEAYAYPGHRDPFPNASERISRLLEHHDRRLLRMRELLGDRDPASKADGAGEGTTSFEMCELLFGKHLRGNPHNLRFAMAETIAHLERLTLAGGAVRTEGRDPDGRRVVRYGPSEQAAE